MKTILYMLLAASWLVGASAAELHVAPAGNDADRGSRRAPLRTIQRAADLAQPGDTITVHSGTYRERVNPPRGGDSDRRRIVYRAAPGTTVEIKGSEVVSGWVRLEHDTWTVALPNTFFGNFNPYADRIRGDWFNARGRDHHTGAVYLDGAWLLEAATLDEVLRPAASEGPPLWFGRVDGAQTRLWAQFPGKDPNTARVEINVRQTVFYPDEPGRNYITVRGFIMRHAATPWAPPTAEQIGLIGTHWSKGWIIEDNVISHAACVGVTLGKHGDAFDNTSEDSADGYIKTIERAHAFRIPWDGGHVGHHIVRNNTISHCEQAGIVGSLGAIFSEISGNHVHDIWVRRQFDGFEMGGIKLHAPIDTLIRGNRVHRAGRGIWLDWMTQGTRVTGNLCYDNTTDDFFSEVNHGPYMVDHNIFLSDLSIRDISQGGAFAHNLLTGRIASGVEPERATPYHPRHTTLLAGFAVPKGGDNRFYNNVFVGRGEPPAEAGHLPQRNPGWGRYATGSGPWVYDDLERPTLAGGNVYYHGARPGRWEEAPALAPGVPTAILIDEGDRVFLDFAAPSAPGRAGTQPVTTALLRQTAVSQQPFLDRNGRPLRLDRDFVGRRRDPDHPMPGPFEGPVNDVARLRVW